MIRRRHLSPIWQDVKRGTGGIAGGNYVLNDGEPAPPYTFGSATFASAATAAVTFSAAEADANYNVAHSSNRPDEIIWVSDRTTDGFTLNSSNATSSARVTWVLIR